MSGLRRGQGRPAVLAGLWYPADRDTLKRQVRLFLDQAGPAPSSNPIGIVSPHAGYAYSGPVAGVAFASVQGQSPARVVLIGPAHRVGFAGISAGDFSTYEGPLGDLPVDRDAIADLEARGLVTCVPAAHAQEHCLEILLPFVTTCFGQTTTILPLLVGTCTDDDVDAVLRQAVRPGDLLVVSTDLSHFLPYAQACQRDRHTLEGIERLDTQVLEGESACGHRGLAGAIKLARRQGWRLELLDYRNSGDTSGDRRRVVGYGAAAFVAP